MTQPPDDPVPASLGRLVRVLAARGMAHDAIAGVTGVPLTLISGVLSGLVGGAAVAGEAEALAQFVGAVLAAEAAVVGVDTQAASDEELARWLAEQSGHPRYTQVTDGWRKLLESTADVEVAYGAAVKRADQPRGATADRLVAARDVLRRVAEAHEARQEAGWQ